jgi:hypothetical protein
VAYALWTKKRRAVGLTKGNGGENKAVGEGYIPAFARIFTLRHRKWRAAGTWATRRTTMPISKKTKQMLRFDSRDRA